MRAVPFYRQTLDFTCGPASLLMAMGTLDPAVALTPRHELDIWREATLAAVPATSRYGLALAAYRRGFRPRVIANTEAMAFRNRIEQFMPVFYRDGALDVLWDDVRARAVEAGIEEARRDPTVKDLEGALRGGEVPIVLTDTYFFGEDEHVPHWVVVGGVGGGGFHVYNPLDEGPGHVVVDVDAMAKALGFEGDSLVVVIGPRAT